MLYLCSILIGRRHWVGSPSGQNKTVHYSIRVVSCLAIAYSLTFFFRNNDVIRIDATAEQLSSLSQGSIDFTLILMAKSRSMRSSLLQKPCTNGSVQTRINLLTALREIDRESKKATVDIHEISAEDNASTTAEKYGVENQNGITPPLFVGEEGRFMPWQKDLYLGLCLKVMADNKPYHLFIKGYL